MKEIKQRYRTYEGGDCYYFTTECKCGEKVGGWSEKIANDNWEKHICKK